MPIKYRLSYNKHMENCQWSHLVGVDFEMINQNEGDFVWGYYNYYNTKLKIIDRVKKQQETILLLLQKNYGPQDIFWNIRWRDAGADIRFKSQSDAASFLMLFTLQPVN